MKFVCNLVSAVAVAALPACGGNYSVRGEGPGSSVIVDGGLSASIRLGATASTVIVGAGIASIVAAGNGLSTEPPPRMKPDRTINEQDCTRPIVNLAANLKCK